MVYFQKQKAVVETTSLQKMIKETMTETTTRENKSISMAKVVFKRDQNLSLMIVMMNYIKNKRRIISH